MARKVLFIALALSFLGVCTWNAEPALGQSNPSGESAESEVATHFTAGQQATRAGQPERAIQEYRQVLRLRPDLTEARVNLGLDYFLVGQYQQAAIESGRRDRKNRTWLLRTYFWACPT